MEVEALLNAMAGAAMACTDCVALHLVGGAVRDQQQGQPLAELRDLDFVVEGSAVALGELLVSSHGGELSSHERFGTATWLGPLWGTPIDLVSARRERYPEPGQLPVVEAGSLEDDLRRRDFTINSIAWRVAPGERGQLCDPSGGLDDLRAGVLRIHQSGSIHDDATRILRLARLAVRFDLEPDETTAVALAEALSSGSLDLVSGDRLWAEWLLLCAEPSPARVLSWMVERGIMDALVPGMATRSLAALKRGLAESTAARPWRPLQSLAIVLDGVDPALAAERFGLQGAQASSLRRLAAVVGDLLTALLASRADDELESLLRHSDEQERALLVAADPAAADAVLRYENHIVTLEPLLRGDELLAAGMEEGQALGEALRRVRVGQLRGDLRTPEEALKWLGLD